MYTVYCIHSKFARSIYFDLITFMRRATILIFLEFATYHSHLQRCRSQLAKLEVVMCHGNACCRIDGFLQVCFLRAQSTYWDMHVTSCFFGWDLIHGSVIDFNLWSFCNHCPGVSALYRPLHVIDAIRSSACTPNVFESHGTSLHIDHPQRWEIRGSLFPPFEHCSLLFRLFGFRCAGQGGWFSLADCNFAELRLSGRNM